MPCRAFISFRRRNVRQRSTRCTVSMPCRAFASFRRGSMKIGVFTALWFQCRARHSPLSDFPTTADEDSLETEFQCRARHSLPSGAILACNHSRQAPWVSTPWPAFTPFRHPHQTRRSRQPLCPPRPLPHYRRPTLNGTCVPGAPVSWACEY